MRQAARAVTLIEMLIVVAILAILSLTVVMMLITVMRAERAASRQTEAMHELALLQSAWRADVRAASAAPASFGDAAASSRTLILRVGAGAAAAGRVAAVVYRIELAEESASGFSVVRNRIAPDGAVVSRQVLAASVDSAEFGATEGPPRFLTLTASAVRGIDAFRSTQQFSALEIPEGAQ